VSEKQEQLARMAEKLNIGGYKRHVLLCVGEACCKKEVGLAAWEKLKELTKDKELSVGENSCYRTRASCLRVCSNGPIAVVYPEGTWYEGMTVERVERLVQEHLIEGKPIEEWIFARNPVGQ
jgi:(2Fe-2S) ferredoxin